MNFFKRAKRQQSRQRVAAATINSVADVAEYSARMRATSPVIIKHTPSGPLIGLTPFTARLAIAVADIAARSGTTAGVGTVHLVNPQCAFSAGAITGCTLTTSTITVSVYNPWSGTQTGGAGIKAGQYCWIQQDASGFYCVFPGECV